MNITPQGMNQEYPLGMQSGNFGCMMGHSGFSTFRGGGTFLPNHFVPPMNVGPMISYYQDVPAAHNGMTIGPHAYNNGNQVPSNYAMKESTAFPGPSNYPFQSSTNRMPMMMMGETRHPMLATTACGVDNEAATLKGDVYFNAGYHNIRGGGCDDHVNDVHAGPAKKRIIAKSLPFISMDNDVGPIDEVSEKKEKKLLQSRIAKERRR
jgi:hypothetical protein